VETYLSYWAEEVKKWAPSVELMRGSVRQPKAQPLQRVPREKARKIGYIRWKATLKNGACMDE